MHGFSDRLIHAEGLIYDSTDKDLVRGQIASFINTYQIDLTELAQPDLTAYQVSQNTIAAH